MEVNDTLAEKTDSHLLTDTLTEKRCESLHDILTEKGCDNQTEGNNTLTENFVVT